MSDVCATRCSGRNVVGCSRCCGVDVCLFSVSVICNSGWFGEGVS